MKELHRRSDCHLTKVCFLRTESHTSFQSIACITKAHENPTEAIWALQVVWGKTQDLPDPVLQPGGFGIGLHFLFPSFPELQSGIISSHFVVRDLLIDYKKISYYSTEQNTKQTRNIIVAGEKDGDADEFSEWC